MVACQGVVGINFLLDGQKSGVIISPDPVFPIDFLGEAVLEVVVRKRAVTSRTREGVVQYLARAVVELCPELVHRSHDIISARLPLLFGDLALDALVWDDTFGQFSLQHSQLRCQQGHELAGLGVPVGVEQRDLLQEVQQSNGFVVCCVHGMVRMLVDLLGALGVPVEVAHIQLEVRLDFCISV